MKVEINGRPISTEFMNSHVKLKVLNEGITLQQAQIQVNKKKDGYDTYGVSMPDGRAALVLRDSSSPLRRRDELIIDGKKATVEFVENEKNTFDEWIHSPRPESIVFIGGGLIVGTVAAKLSGNAGIAIVAGWIGGILLASGAHYVGLRKPRNRPRTDSVTDAIAVLAGTNDS